MSQLVGLYWNERVQIMQGGGAPYDDADRELSGQYVFEQACAYYAREVSDGADRKLFGRYILDRPSVLRKEGRPLC